MKKLISLEGKFKDLLIMAEEDPFLKGIIEVDVDKERVPIVYNNTLAGFYTPRQTLYKGTNYWRTGAIYILPQYRQKGLASKTIKEFFEDKQNGLAFIEPHNVASMKTFESAGFINTGTMKGKHSGDTFNVMIKNSKELKPAFLSW